MVDQLLPKIITSGKITLSLLHCSPTPLAAQLLHHFTPSGQITPSLLHHFIPLAAQLLHQFTPSEQITPSFLHHFTPLPAQLLHHFNPSEKFTPSFLHLFTTLDCPTIRSLYPLLNKLPSHSYTTLPPLATHLLHHCKSSEQITPSLLHHFTHLGIPTLKSFYPLWTNYPLTFTPIYSPWRPNYYIILQPLNKSPPHSYTILTTLASQLLNHFSPSEPITPSLLNPFTPLGGSTLTSF